VRLSWGPAGFAVKILEKTEDIRLNLTHFAGLKLVTLDPYFRGKILDTHFNKRSMFLSSVIHHILIV
jgi:hypothetical protein